MGESLISDTSAVIRVNQNVKQRIFMNHLTLIILINLAQLCSTFFMIVWTPWFRDIDYDSASANQNGIPPSNSTTQEALTTSTPSDANTIYGLLFYETGNSREMNSFTEENNKQ